MSSGLILAESPIRDRALMLKKIIIIENLSKHSERCKFWLDRPWQSALSLLRIVGSLASGWKSLRDAAVQYAKHLWRYSLVSYGQTGKDAHCAGCFLDRVVNSFQVDRPNF